MIKLNLETKNKGQELIKAYLEENVSEVLADKINNGVKIVKDDKPLINKKDLDGFMAYASDEAKKQAEQGARSACIEDCVVYGWAVHYFEEDSIEGKLYNEDGTEYKTVQQKVNTPAPKKQVEKPKPKDNQQSLFDLFDNPPSPEPKEELEDEEIVEADEPIDADDDWTEEEMDEALEEIHKEYVAENNRLIDKTTGEILPTEVQESTSIKDKHAIYLATIFDNMEIKL